MPSPIIPVLLAGGAGTRLWPVSRDALPKQFLPLVGERSTYQETLLRVARPDVREPDRHHRAEFPFLRPPAGRGGGRGGDRGDRADAARFGPGDRGGDGRGARDATRTPWCWRWPPTTSSSTCRNSARLARPGARRRKPAISSPSASSPSEPKTSYGYILPGEAIGETGAHKVARFVEKPDAATAEKYVAEGYLWNSGNFLFRADVLLDELKRLEPEMAEAIEAAVKGATTDLGFLRLAAARPSRARRRNRSTMR